MTCPRSHHMLVGLPVKLGDLTGVFTLTPWSCAVWSVNHQYKWQADIHGLTPKPLQMPPSMAAGPGRCSEGSWDREVLLDCLAGSRIIGRVLESGESRVSKSEKAK